MAIFDALFFGGTSPTFTGADRARLARLENKVDLILKHLGLEYRDASPPCALSPEVQELALNPYKKIQAIKLHREQTGVGLKEAKDAVESFIASGR